jgi:hypothetical protein
MNIRKVLGTAITAHDDVLNVTGVQSGQEFF